MSNKFGNERKSVQLGMPFGTATNKLRKELLFDCVKRLKLDTCFRCGKPLDSIDNFSIEHKKAWLDTSDPITLFFDLDNIAYSHLSCNASAGRRVNTGSVQPHGTRSRYTHNSNLCHCSLCKEANTNYEHARRNNGSAATMAE